MADKKSSKTIIIGIIVLVLFLIAGGVFYWWYSSRMNISVKISPTNVNVENTIKQQFKAVVTDSNQNAKDMTVTWSVDDSSKGTITNTGLFTAKADSGTVHVIAMSKADPTKKDQITVTLKPKAVTPPNNPPEQTNYKPCNIMREIGRAHV